LNANGSTDEAQNKADELLELIQKNPHKKAMKFYYDLMARIELERGDISKAIEYSQKAVSLLSHQRYLNYWEQAPILNTLAMAYYKFRDWKNAREIYMWIISLTMGRIDCGDIYALSYYMLGKIHEQEGNRALAAEHYEKFLSLWKDADPGIAEVEDAREKLSGLKSQ